MKSGWFLTRDLVSHIRFWSIVSLTYFIALSCPLQLVFIDDLPVKITYVYFVTVEKTKFEGEVGKSKASLERGITYYLMQWNLSLADT